jgi:hypothetical protein
MINLRISMHSMQSSVCREVIHRILGGNWGVGIPEVSREVLNILLPATSYLYKIGFSVVATIRTKNHFVMNLENYIRATITKLYLRYDKLCTKRQTHLSH